MERLGGDLERELGRLGPAGRIGELAQAWPAVVGDSIARNSWPSRVGRDGTLHVATSSSTWAFELAQLAPTILERLHSALGAAAPPVLRFAPGPLPEPPAPSDPVHPSSPHPVRPTDADRRAAEELAAGVADDELRALVARAAAASLARASSSDQRTATTGASATLPPPANG